jgi:hypothetical protein
MKACRLFGMFVVVLAISAIGCAADQDDDENGTSADAVATPRGEEGAASSRRLEEIRLALENARPEDFQDDLASNIRSRLVELRQKHSAADGDPKAAIHSFMTGVKKAYIVETRPTDKTQAFYVYDAIGDKSALANWFFPEHFPVGLGTCTSTPGSSTVTCKSVAQGARLF